MKNKSYIAFAKSAIWFFAISHILAYIISTFQTFFIVKEVRKAQRKAVSKNDPY